MRALTIYVNEGDKCHEHLSGKMVSTIEIGAVSISSKEELKKDPSSGHFMICEHVGRWIFFLLLSYSLSPFFWVHAQCSANTNEPRCDMKSRQKRGREMISDHGVRCRNRIS